MIERLNFYDIYGYLLPGTCFLAIVLLPFGIAFNLWPPTQLGSTIIGLAIGYVVGHLLQRFADAAFPHNIRSTSGKVGPPSEILLDDGDESLPPALKQRLQEGISQTFGLNISDTKERATAFFMCRSFLLKRGAAAYAEQFQGLYSMMRGLMVASMLGAVYLLGWSIAVFTPQSITVYLMTLAGLCVSSAAVLNLEGRVPNLSKGLFGTGQAAGRNRMRTALGMVACCLFLVALAGPYSGHPPTHAMEFFGGVVLCIGVSFVSYTRYKHFARQFGIAVYRDFVVVLAKPDELVASNPS